MNFIKNTDREVRKTVYEKIQNRRLQDKQELDELFSRLVKKRHQVAINAGFDNYRDYMFKALGRFDYTAEDCFKFHDAIEKVLVPVFKEFADERSSALNIKTQHSANTKVDV